MTGAASGYSGQPLWKKLGVKASDRLLLVDAPAGYLEWLGDLPPGVALARTAGPGIALAHVFATERAALAARLPTLRRQLAPQAALWVSWPKKAAKVPTTLTEDVIRELALPLGYVDVKVCAVSAVWSGLKLVVRRELR